MGINEVWRDSDCVSVFCANSVTGAACVLTPELARQFAMEILATADDVDGESLGMYTGDPACCALIDGKFIVVGDIEFCNAAQIDTPARAEELALWLLRAAREMREWVSDG